MKDTTKRTLPWRRAAIGGTVGLALLGVAAAAAPAQAATVPDVLAKIRYCESGNNYQAQNPSSSASGAYQFLNSTWQSLSASAGYATAKSAPASVQDAAAIELYNAQGTAPWAASQSCWASLGAVSTTSTGSAGSTGSATGTSTSAGTGTTTAGTTSTGSSTPSTTRDADRTHGAPARSSSRPAPLTAKKVNTAAAQGNRTDHDGDGKRDCGSKPAGKSASTASARSTAHPFAHTVAAR